MIYRVVQSAPLSDLPRQIEWLIAATRGKIKALPEGLHKFVLREWERRKSQVRALVGHPFHIIKNLFKHRKVRYRGLAKNIAQLYTLFALANLVIAGRTRRTFPAI